MENICQECGRPFSGHGGRKYCSDHCYNIHHYRLRKAKLAAAPAKVCPYNEGVNCPGGSSCEKCGWNPEVAKERTAAFLTANRKERTR